MLKHEYQQGVTVVTPTYEREKQLACCIHQVKAQRTSFPVRHIVVCDGPSELAAMICQYFGVTCLAIEKETDKIDSRGHLARDVGLMNAKTEFVCFWDDDNLYYEHALQTLYDATQGHDIGVCNIQYLYKEEPPNLFQLPADWQGVFELGRIDTMNVMLRTSLARQQTWAQHKVYEGDYLYLKSLEAYNPKINYVPELIGIHL